MDEPDILRRFFLPGDLDLPFPTEIDNYLLNSSFGIATSHDRLPDWWQSTGSGATVGTGLLGSKSIELLPGALAAADVYQENDELIRAGVPWCFYVWYSSTATGLTAPVTGFGLEVIGTRADASTETLRTAFEADTGGYARRCVVRGAFSQDIVKWKFRPVVTNSAGFPVTTPVVVDMAMASPGNQVIDWRPNPFDNYPYIDYYDTLSPIVSEYGTRAQFVEKMGDFWLTAIPTRASGVQLLSSGGVLDVVPSVPDINNWINHDTAGTFIEVDYFKEEWEAQWQLGYDGASPKVRGYGVDAPDIFGPFDLAFRNWRNYFEDGVSWTPEAMTTLHGYLLVVLQKQDHTSTTRRYCAIVDPRMPRPFPSYMEVIAMVELTGISTSTQISQADVKYSDQQHLYVGNGESEWAFDLNYDYFMVDFSRRILYFREDYNEVVPQLVARPREA